MTYFDANFLKKNIMEFGLPKVKAQKKEKYENTGVLTFLPTGPGLGRKIVFNAKAVEILEITDDENKISFSFSGNDIYIVNTSNSSVSNLSVSKTAKSISDKKHYEYIKYTINNSSEKDELELFLIPTEREFNGKKVFCLSQTAPEIDEVEKHLAVEEKTVQSENSVSAEVNDMTVVDEETIIE